MLLRSLTTLTVALSARAGMRSYENAGRDLGVGSRLRPRNPIFIINDYSRRMSLRDFIRRLARDQDGATAIEYCLILALIGLALVVVLPEVAQSIRATMVTAREGMKGKLCEGDPTQSGTQCR